MYQYVFAAERTKVYNQYAKSYKPISVRKKITSNLDKNSSRVLLVSFPGRFPRSNFTRNG